MEGGAENGVFRGEGVGICFFAPVVSLQFEAEAAPKRLPAGFVVVITISIVRVWGELIGKAPAVRQTLAFRSHGCKSLALV